MQNLSKYIAPLSWVLVYQLISYGIGVVTRANMGWYDMLAKSAANPPDIVFPVMWTILYVFLALAGYEVWKKCAKTSPAFILYWVQMLLNWGWSFVFFAAHEIAFGFYWIVAVDLALLAFIVVGWNRCRLAAVYCIPTLLWGLFAGYLNYAIMVLN